MRLRYANEESFLETWDQLGGVRRTGKNIFELLRTLYTAEGRSYHNLEHIDHTLGVLITLAPHLAQTPEASFAIWLHDAICDPRARDNEERSADLSDGLLRLAVRSDAYLTRAYIISTKHEPHSPVYLGSGYIMDTDLSVFGGSEEEFDRYDRGIQEEYSWAPVAEYRTKRRQVLLRFLNRHHIYKTAEFRDRYERAARENLTRAIARLA